MGARGLTIGISIKNQRLLEAQQSYVEGLKNELS